MTTDSSGGLAYSYTLAHRRRLLDSGGDHRRRDLAGDDPFSSGIYVTTDDSDYSPGQNVTVMGRGFAPGETISLLFRQTYPGVLEDRSLVCVADGMGASSIANSWSETMT